MTDQLAVFETEHWDDNDVATLVTNVRRLEVTVKQTARKIIEAEIRGIRRYAWWQDGVQYVGSGVYTLEDALAPLLKGTHSNG